ncbi:MAG TPA: S8 family serine peptidase [Gammaproteobacteria bacterium]|nr:S8 family serine peptidase [Gammaproteobacteria bacterium]
MAQLDPLDDLLDDVIDEQVEQQLEEALEEVVEDAVQDQVEETVEAAVEATVEAAVEDTVEETVESAVEETVESAVAGTVEATVEAAVETVVTNSIVQQVESGVTETVQQQIESGVTGTVAQQLESTVEQTLEGTLESVVEQGLGPLEDTLEDVVEGVGEGLGQGLGEALGGLTPIEGDDDETPTETFAGGLDALGRGTEREVWVVLVPDEHVDRIAGWGFNIRARQTLGGLNRVLLRVDAPEDRDIAQAALDLALDAPGTVVDFNHLYEPSDEAAAPGAAAATVTGRVQGAPPSSAPPAVTIGIIDSSVAVEHAAFRDADIVQRDFVPFAAPRPLDHGTAVASLLVGENGTLRPRQGRARLNAAAVFFADDAGNAIATTASLAAALSWQAAERVAVVNMSLAGPPNRVLETAIEAATADGMLVVAAVGNNGPAGEPLYPAAYPTVIGVTAVDSAHRIYRYANRGRHVMFAAPGVRVKVAKSHGGYETRSGTSMAAPHAAAIIAQSVEAKIAPSSDGVVAALQVAAVDLGVKNFDDVFGHGLIAAVAEPAVVKNEF